MSPKTIPITMNFDPRLGSIFGEAKILLPQEVVDGLAEGRLIFSSSFRKSPNTEFEITSISIIPVSASPVYMRLKPQVEI